MLEKRFVAPGTPAAGGSLPEPSGHGKGATIMTRSGAVTLAFLALAIPATTLAQAQVEIQLNLPGVLPPLVEIRPGVRVVRDLDEEVFYARNYYWVRRDGHWFRARDHRRRWAYVEPRRAPPELVQSPPGHYRRWRGNEAERQGRGGEMEHGRHDQDRGQR
jgi:hypothetical protein